MSSSVRCIICNNNFSSRVDLIQHYPCSNQSFDISKVKIEIDESPVHSSNWPPQDTGQACPLLPMIGTKIEVETEVSKPSNETVKSSTSATLNVDGDVETWATKIPESEKGHVSESEPFRTELIRITLPHSEPLSIHSSLQKCNAQLPKLAENKLLKILPKIDRRQKLNNYAYQTDETSVAKNARSNQHALKGCQSQNLLSRNASFLGAPSSLFLPGLKLQTAVRSAATVRPFPGNVALPALTMFPNCPALTGNTVLPTPTCSGKLESTALQTSNHTAALGNPTLSVSNHSAVLVKTIPACNLSTIFGNTLLPASNISTMLGNTMIPSSNNSTILGNTVIPTSIHSNILGNTLLPSPNHSNILGNTMLPSLNHSTIPVNTMLPSCSSSFILGNTGVPTSNHSHVLGNAMLLSPNNSSELGKTMLVSPSDSTILGNTVVPTSNHSHVLGNAVSPTTDKPALLGKTIQSPTNSSVVFGNTVLPTSNNSTLLANAMYQTANNSGVLGNTVFPTHNHSTALGKAILPTPNHTTIIRNNVVSAPRGPFLLGAPFRLINPSPNIQLLPMHSFMSPVTSVSNPTAPNECNMIGTTRVTSQTHNSMTLGNNKSSVLKNIPIAPAPPPQSMRMPVLIGNQIIMVEFPTGPQVGIMKESTGTATPVTHSPFIQSQNLLAPPVSTSHFVSPMTLGGTTNMLNMEKNSHNFIPPLGSCLSNLSRNTAVTATLKPQQAELLLHMKSEPITDIEEDPSTCLSNQSGNTSHEPQHAQPLLHMKSEPITDIEEDPSTCLLNQSGNTSHEPQHAQPLLHIKSEPIIDIEEDPSTCLSNQSGNTVVTATLEPLYTQPLIHIKSEPIIDIEEDSSTCLLKSIKITAVTGSFEPQETPLLDIKSEPLIDIEEADSINLLNSSINTANRSAFESQPTQPPLLIKSELTWQQDVYSSSPAPHILSEPQKTAVVLEKTQPALTQETYRSPLTSHKDVFVVAPACSKTTDWSSPANFNPVILNTFSLAGKKSAVHESSKRQNVRQDHCRRRKGRRRRMGVLLTKGSEVPEMPPKTGIVVALTRLNTPAKLKKLMPNPLTDISKWHTTLQTTHTNKTVKSKIRSKVLSTFRKNFKKIYSLSSVPSKIKTAKRIAKREPSSSSSNTNDPILILPAPSSAQEDAAKVLPEADNEDTSNNQSVKLRIDGLTAGSMFLGPLTQSQMDEILKDPRKVNELAKIPQGYILNSKALVIRQPGPASVQNYSALQSSVISTTSVEAPHTNPGAANFDALFSDKEQMKTTVWFNQKMRKILPALPEERLSSGHSGVSTDTSSLTAAVTSTSANGISCSEEVIIASTLDSPSGPAQTISEGCSKESLSCGTSGIADSTGPQTVYPPEQQKKRRGRKRKGETITLINNNKLTFNGDINILKTALKKATVKLEPLDMNSEMMIAAAGRLSKASTKACSSEDDDMRSSGTDNYISDDNSQRGKKLYMDDGRKVRATRRSRLKNWVPVEVVGDLTIRGKLLDADQATTQRSSGRRRSKRISSRPRPDYVDLHYNYLDDDISHVQKSECPMDSSLHRKSIMDKEKFSTTKSDVISVLKNFITSKLFDTVSIDQSKEVITPENELTQLNCTPGFSCGPSSISKNQAKNKIGTKLVNEINGNTRKNYDGYGSKKVEDLEETKLDSDQNKTVSSLLSEFNFCGNLANVNNCECSKKEIKVTKNIEKCSKSEIELIKKIDECSKSDKIVAEKTELSRSEIMVSEKTEYSKINIQIAEKIEECPKSEKVVEKIEITSIHPDLSGNASSKASEMPNNSEDIYYSSESDSDIFDIDVQLLSSAQKQKLMMKRHSEVTMFLIKHSDKFQSDGDMCQHYCRVCCRYRTSGVYCLSRHLRKHLSGALRCGRCGYEACHDRDLAVHHMTHSSEAQSGSTGSKVV